MRRKVTAADWVNRAIVIMGTKSVEHVSIEAIARDLGVTKGSFYWHFKDHADLLLRCVECFFEDYSNGGDRHIWGDAPCRGEVFGSLRHAARYRPEIAEAMAIAGARYEAALVDRLESEARCAS